MTDHTHHRHTDGDVYSTTDPNQTRRCDDHPDFTRVWCGSPESDDDVEALAKAWGEALLKAWGESYDVPWEKWSEDLRGEYLSRARKALTALTKPVPDESYCLLDGDGDWWVSEDGERWRCPSHFNIGSTPDLIANAYGIDDGTPKPPPQPTDPATRVTDSRDNIWRLLADGDWVCVDGPDSGEFIDWARLAGERGGRVDGGDA